MTAAGLRVTPMADSYGYMVGGTDDVDAARTAAKETCRADLLSDGWAEDDPGLTERLSSLDRMRARTGLWRWTPCNERSCYDGGGHRGHLAPAEKPGRGVFRGVYLGD